jgi:acetoin utilization protein AcuB
VNAPPTIKHAMTPFPWSIDAGRDVAEAWQMMADLDIRHLPVTEGGRLVGIVSGRDLGLTMDSRLGSPQGSGVKVGELCAQEPFVVETTAPLAWVAREMAERRLGSVLVVYQGRLAGIFTTTDACRVLAEMLAERFPGGGDDAA